MENVSNNSAEAQKIRFRNLRRFNIGAFLLHLAQGTAMLLLSNDFSLPVNTSFVEFNPQTRILEPFIEEAFTLRLGPLVAGFLFLSAAAHLTISLPGIYQWYVNGLKKGINIARWLEYSLSSSLMIIVIAMLAGIYDGVALLFAFFLNAMMILFGWMMELHNQDTVENNWTSYWFGCLAGIIPWVGIALHLFGAGGETGATPDFVYWIFFSLFIFFNIFALNMVLQYKKVGRWENYVFGEKVYIILSLVAKSLLAWQVWAGTLRPV